MGKEAERSSDPEVRAHAENVSQDYFLMHGIGAEDVLNGSFTLPTEDTERLMDGAAVDAYDVEQAELETQRQEAVQRARALLAQQRRDDNPWQIVRLS